jgi:hypothetical protein
MMLFPPAIRTQVWQARMRNLERPSEDHWLLLVRCLELFSLWSWTDDFNPSGRDDDHWSGHLINLLLSLQTI